MWGAEVRELAMSSGRWTPSSTPHKAGFESRLWPVLPCKLPGC